MSTKILELYILNRKHRKNIKKCSCGCGEYGWITVIDGPYSLCCKVCGKESISWAYLNEAIDCWNDINQETLN